MGLLENSIRKCLIEKAFSDSIRSGFLVPYQKSRFLMRFSNSIRSGLRFGCVLIYLFILQTKVLDSRDMAYCMQSLRYDIF